MAQRIEHNGKTFLVCGRFGNFSVYLARRCIAFGIMTANDAQNWIWKHY